MKKPQTIRDEAFAESSINFDTLRKEGIAMAQELAGETWTDYNEHDPGVTILEALCYALTELAYKTRFPVQDLLLRKPDQRIKPGDNAFYRASDILPCSALTVDDFRMMLIDRVQQLRNVWLVPVTSVSSDQPLHGWRSKGIRGLYHVYLQLIDYSENEQKREHVVAEVRKHLNEHRNLCEDVEQITVQQPLPLTIQADIQVSAHTRVETILSDIYLALQDHLSPMIRFYSLQEQQETGMSVNQIFNGPALYHGFIRDRDLRNPLAIVRKSDLIRVISTVNGVSSVSSLKFQLGGEEVERNQDLSPDQVAWLAFTPRQTDDFRFLDANVTYRANHTEVHRLISQKQSRIHRNYRLNLDDDNDLPFPIGKFRNLQAYHTIQNSFPNTYGIGPNGLGGSEKPARYAQAKQLKAYLLLFEQLMADYASQLVQVGNLFSTDPTVDQTYFFQDLFDLPGMWDLYDPHTGKKKASEEEVAKSKEQVRQRLKRLYQEFDPAVERKNRFLNNLLARFNEYFHTYLLTKFDPYFTDEEFAMELVQWKTRFLKRYVWVSRDRGKGFNYQAPSWNAWEQQREGSKERSNINVSGFAERVALLLGIENYTERSLADVFTRSDIQTVSAQTSDLSFSSERVEMTDQRKAFDVQYVDYSMLDQAKSTEDGAFTFAFTGKHAMEEFLRFGIDKSNYTAVETGAGDDRSFRVLFRNPMNGKASEVYQAKRPGQANQAIEQVSSFLSEVNRKSEGLHILEHNLLRPNLDEDRFSFEFKGSDPNRLKAPDFTPFRERHNRLKTLFPLVDLDVDQYTYEVQSAAAGTYVIQVRYGDDLLAVSAEPYKTRKDADEALDIVKERVVHLQTHPHEQADAIRLLCKPDEQTINEKFFPFQLSVVLPRWPARFQNEDFQRLLERTLIENVPAQVIQHFYWLSMEDMARFETLYKAWLAERMEHPESHTSVNGAALIRFLENLYTHKHG